MGNLLSSDLRRIRKDKLMMVALIIAVVFSVVTPLLYFAIFQGIDDTTTELLGIGTSAKNLFFAAFNIGNDLGLIAPLLIAIILFKDFSFGTIRNKIIAGKSRSSIFLSMYASCLIAVVVVTLVYAFLTLGVSLLLFPYQDSAFLWSDLWYFLSSMVLELVLYFFVAALVCYVTVSSKNVGLVIVKYLGIVMGVTIVTSILQLALMAAQMENGQGTAVKVMEFIQRINIYNFVNVIGRGTSYTGEDLAYLLITPVVLTALLLLIGNRKLCKKDIK